MKRDKLLMCVMGILVATAAWEAPAETFALQDKVSQRKLRVVRHFEISTRKGNAAVIALPALMSFWGETNWQLIKSSHFSYSEKPDKTEVVSEDAGFPRRLYQITWNDPKADKIIVDQTLEVDLACFNTLYTTAKLPYTEAVLKRFTSCMGADAQEGINPDNPALAPICDAIVKKAHSAEDVVEGVCDWINENINFVKGQRTSDEALGQRQGSCTPMSLLACSMLRRIGIPAAMVDAKFIGKDSGHSFIEVYFPDAGWVFYDLSNWNRGYKSLDCLMTVGWSYRSGTGRDAVWSEGYFCMEKDSGPFTDRSESASRLIRKAPKGFKICSTAVMAQHPPTSLKIRQRPLRELILDMTVPAGQRDYTDNVLGEAVAAGSAKQSSVK